MPVPTTISDLSTTASSNGPDGATEAGSVLDDYLRAHAGLMRGIVSAGSDITSASTITPPATGESFILSGTTTVTAIASTNSWDGRIVWFRHTGAHSFTNSATLVCLGGASITFASGDFSAWRQRTSGTWDQVAMHRGDGAFLGDSWSVDTSGRLLNGGNTQPLTYLHTSASRTTTGTFDTYTEEVNRGNTTSAANGTIQVPVSGVYTIAFNVDATTSATYGSGYAIVSLQIGGVNLGKGANIIIIPGPGVGGTLSWTGTIPLVATNSLSLHCGSIVGANTNVYIRSFSVRLEG